MNESLFQLGTRVYTYVLYISSTIRYFVSLFSFYHYILFNEAVVKDIY
ncbi:hypothetical protein HNQ93_001258 [Hymenobacter luteus]|uniref:Uncharacterized protein n=2 Tax=Hymenobacter TaxID=89966 RepID=A0A7W9SYT3_9BACT|nr:hypothetical protein [Hymenobacter latericoloratus]MBB6058412.1 hypothetical protein [Hymenobacter luteus]